MKKAVVYLRVSGKGQLFGSGFDRQLETIQKRAEFAGYELVKTVEEKAVSGTKETSDRPALSELLQFLADNPDAKTILVERADRVARDLIVSELILAECRQLGITIIDAESGQDLTREDPDDPTSKLIRQILAAVAEFEKCSIVKRLRAGRRILRKQTNGVRGTEGVKPYGHFEAEKPILGRIRELSHVGAGPSQIADELNGLGALARNGKSWTRQSVFSIMKRTSEKE